MSALSGDLFVLILKLALGTLAFAWILWTVRDVNPRAVGMTLTFPALNGIVLLTITDKVVSEMVIGIFPLMLFNGFLAAIFVVLRRRFSEWPAIALCLLFWVALALLLEWQALWPYRGALAAIAAILVVVCAAGAFRALRGMNISSPVSQDRTTAPAVFLRERGARIGWFFVSLVIVSVVAYVFHDAHSLVGRLSALPLVPLFVLHWAVNERRINLIELRVSALIGPLAAGAFLIVFTLSLGLVRSDAAELHPLYWPVGLAMLLIEWELTRRLILLLSRLTYRE